jgi:hypothetical protein
MSFSCGKPGCNSSMLGGSQVEAETRGEPKESMAEISASLSSISSIAGFGFIK